MISMYKTEFMEELWPAITERWPRWKPYRQEASDWFAKLKDYSRQEIVDSIVDLKVALGGRNPELKDFLAIIKKRRKEQAMIKPAEKPMTPQEKWDAIIKSKNMSLISHLRQARPEFDAYCKNYIDEVVPGQWATSLAERLADARYWAPVEDEEKAERIAIQTESITDIAIELQRYINAGMHPKHAENKILKRLEIRRQ